jgi:hypothetical protein
MGQPDNQPLHDAEDAEAERLPAGVMADQQRTAVIADEDDLDETQARIKYIEGVIGRSLGGITAILWIVVIIELNPDPSSGGDQNLPTWLWWVIGIAGVMLALTLLAFRTKMPRRIAVFIVTNSIMITIRSMAQRASAALGTPPSWRLNSGHLAGR